MEWLVKYKEIKIDNDVYGIHVIPSEEIDFNSDNHTYSVYSQSLKGKYIITSATKTLKPDNYYVNKAMIEASKVGTEVHNYMESLIIDEKISFFDRKFDVNVLDKSYKYFKEVSLLVNNLKDISDKILLPIKECYTETKFGLEILKNGNFYAILAGTLDLLLVDINNNRIITDYKVTMNKSNVKSYKKQMSIYSLMTDADICFLNFLDGIITVMPAEEGLIKDWILSLENK